jgi:hypothetical protein
MRFIGFKGNCKTSCAVRAWRSAPEVLQLPLSNTSQTAVLDKPFYEKDRSSFIGALSTTAVAK